MKNENAVAKQKGCCREGLSAGSSVSNSIQGGDPRQKPSGMTLNLYPLPACGVLPPQGGQITARGFTLIELLVVVLIIGILAAVALPQYQVAVEKAKVARVLPLLRSLSDARTLYYLANGELPCHIEDLDISFPYESKTEMGGRYSCTEADYRYNFSEGGFIALGSKDDLIFYRSQKDDYHIDVYREPRTWGTKMGNIVCVANLRVGTLGEKLCKSLGTYAYSNEVQQDFYVANF